MKIWRVYTGAMGNGSIHRIAVAENAEQAIEICRKAGMKINTNVTSPAAEEVIDMSEFITYYDADVRPWCENEDQDL